MKNFAIRVAAIVGFAFLLIVPGSEFGPTGDLVWSVMLSLAFAYVTMFATDASVFFVLSVVVLLTVAFPLAVLLAIGYPIHHSLTETAAMLMINLFQQPLPSVLRFALPALVITGTIRQINHLAQARISKQTTTGIV
jgi:hypothetical protein